MNPKLTDLARHSCNGVANPLALINALAEAIDGMTQDEVRNSDEVKIVVGLLSSPLSIYGLCHQSRQVASIPVFPFLSAVFLCFFIPILNH